MTLIKSISGIRGTIGGSPGSNLTPTDIIKYTAAFASTLQEEKGKPDVKIIIGRDGRVSGEIICRLVAATLQSIGANVIDLGLSTTPTVEHAVTYQHADGGIILTASHNPMEWNALKLLNDKGEFLSKEAATALLKKAESEEYLFATVRQLGNYNQYKEAISDHIDAILKLPLVEVEAIRSAGFSVVIDAINSAGAVAIPLLLNRLGVKNIKILNGEVNGLFAHNPEPLPDHLHEISGEMRKNNYSVGFVVDPDVDRLAIVMENGEMFGEEYTLVAVADWVLQHQKGDAVSNLSSSRALDDLCLKHGVKCHKSAVGEVHVVEMMKKKDAVIGGEGNGGVIYPALHYGRDALLGIALFLSYMAKSGKDCMEIRRQYSSYHISKNKIDLPSEIDLQNILDNIALQYAKYQVNTVDGVKIDFEDSWVHLRPSNTEPIIRIYAEANNKSTADHIADKILKDIRELMYRN